MALIRWDSSLSVGINEIDGQHQKLIGMINDLNEEMRQGKGKEILGRLLTALVAYTGTHFRTEETYFDQFRYPETDSHKREHEAFVRKVVEFKAGFEAGRLGLSLQIMDFLSHWLQNHIKGVDKQYGPFLNAQGLK